MMKLIFVPILLLGSFSSFGQEKFVNIKGHNYNVFIEGFENRKENTPVIVFENGMGADFGSWNKVIHEISRFAPVLTYDRAGIGKSDKVYTMPTVNHVAENLHDILKKKYPTTIYIDWTFIRRRIYKELFGFLSQRDCGLGVC